MNIGRSSALLCNYTYVLLDVFILQVWIIEPGISFWGIRLSSCSEAACA